MTIRQLDKSEIEALAATCRPYEIPGAVLVEKSTLLSLCNEAMYARSQAGQGTLEVRSLVSMRDGLPYVTLVMGNTRVQLNVKEALHHAFVLLQVAAGAAADGFLVAFTAEHLELSPAARTGVLKAFREYRDTKLELLSPDDLPLPQPEDE
jgi:hypothetical protein